MKMELPSEVLADLGLPIKPGTSGEQPVPVQCGKAISAHADQWANSFGLPVSRMPLKYISF